MTAATRDTAQQADQQLPDQVDTEQHSDLLGKLSINPGDLFGDIGKEVRPMSAASDHLAGGAHRGAYRPTGRFPGNFAVREPTVNPRMPKTTDRSDEQIAQIKP